TDPEPEWRSPFIRFVLALSSELDGQPFGRTALSIAKTCQKAISKEVVEVFRKRERMRCFD
ncbi:MAG: hypothetical protein AAFY15_12805, partial [Cyanobacteria bacterium J06648_11]